MKKYLKIYKENTKQQAYRPEGITGKKSDTLTKWREKSLVKRQSWATVEFKLDVILLCGTEGVWAASLQ